MPDPIKLSAQPVIRAVLARTRVPLLLHPADEPDENKRNPTVGLRDFAGALARYGPGPNHRPDLWKEVRYFSRVDRDGDPYGGDTFEELDKDLCCQFTTIIVEFYRTNPSQVYTYGQRLVAVYDDSPTPQAYINRSATFDTAPGSLVPAKFVPVESSEAQHGYVRRDTNPPSITDWFVGELSIWDLGGDVFATAKQAGGPFPAFTGEEDAYWKPAAKPSAPDLTATVNQHTQQLATLAARAANLYAHYADNTVAPFDDLDSYLAAASLHGGTLRLEGEATSLLITKTNRGGWPAFWDAAGATVFVPAGQALKSSAAGAENLTFGNFYLEGGGTFLLSGQMPQTTPPGRASRLFDGFSNIPVDNPANVVTLDGGYYTKLTGAGKYYLTGTVQVDDMSGASNVVDLRASTSSDQYSMLDYAASMALDFAASSAQLLKLSGALSITATANRRQGQQLRLHLANVTASAVALSWPAAWHWRGIVPTALAAGKQATLSLECAWGSAESDIIAGFAPEY